MSSGAMKARCAAASIAKRRQRDANRPSRRMRHKKKRSSRNRNPIEKDGKGAVNTMAHSNAMPSPLALPGVSKIIAVGSGKGGVGKTTVAVNIAIALSKLGQRVGLIDADISGPNLPLMMGSSQQPKVGQDNQIEPNDT